MFLSAVSNNDVDAEVNAVTLVEDVLEDLLGSVQSHSNNIDAPSGLPKSPSCVPAKSAKTMWQEMAYRAIRKKSDEEVFTPAKFNGDVRSNQDIVMESPNLTPRPGRRGTLGSLSDVLMDMKIEDEASSPSAGQSFGRLVDQDVVMASPVTTPRPGRRESPGSLSHALMGMKMKDGASPAVRSVQRLRDSVPGSEAKGSVSTPTDLPRIKLVSPPPPAKLDYSPTKMDGVLPKRSLFDSPVPVTDPSPPAFISFSDSNPELGPRLKSPISLKLVSTNTAEMRLGSTSSFVGDEDEEPRLKSPVLLFSPANGENDRRLGSTSSATKISIRDEESDVKLKIPRSPKCIESPTENGGLSVFFNELVEHLLDACHQRVKELCVDRKPSEISTEKPGDLRNTFGDNVVEAEETPNVQVSTGLVLSEHSNSVVAEKALIEDGMIKVIHPQIQPIDVIPKLSCSFDEKSIAGALNENSCQQTDGRRKMSRHSSLKSLKPQGQSGGTPKTVKFCEAPPLKISPKPFMETPEDDMEFLLKKIKSMKARKEVEENETADSINTEASFALPSTLDLPDLSQDVSDDKHTFLISNSGIDVGSHYLEQEDVEKSVLASHGGDFSLSYPSHLPSTRREVSTAEATMTVLQHQAILLDKDKQIAAVGEEVLAKNAEIEDLLMKIKYVDNNNSDLEVVVAECAKTVSQLKEERLKEVEALMESKEKLSKEIEQSNEDLQVISIDLLRIFLLLHIPSFLEDLFHCKFPILLFLITLHHFSLWREP